MKIEISDEPIREGAILRNDSVDDSIPPLVEVNRRLYDVDLEGWRYQLTCATKTWYSTLQEDDVLDMFNDTDLTNSQYPKAIQHDAVRERLQELCDHRWVTVHDRETHEEKGEECLSCGAFRRFENA